MNPTKYRKSVLIPKKLSANQLSDVLIEGVGPEAGERAHNYILQWFEENPRKTCLHIPNLNLKVRKSGVNYSVEEA